MSIGSAAFEKALVFTYQMKSELPTPKSFVEIKPNFKLLLNFDVNLTITARDRKRNILTVEDSINLLLAKNTTYCWDENVKTPLSYADYVRQLFPGNLLEVIDKIDERLKTFMTFIKNSDLPIKKQVVEEYNQLEKALKGALIFPSFFSLIKQLREDNIDFHLFLRTFGSDSEDIVTEIEKNMPNEKFSHHCEFSSKKWKIIDANRNLQTIEKTEEVYHFFKSGKHQHLAVQDCYKDWHESGFDSEEGKRFLFKLSDLNHKEQAVLSLFFDDFIGNVSKDPKQDIIAPIDVETKILIPVCEVKKRKMAFSIDTIQAILDKDYFKNLVYGSLETNGFIKGENK